MNYKSNIYDTNYVLSEIYKININTNSASNNIIKQNYHLDSKTPTLVKINNETTEENQPDIDANLLNISKVSFGKNNNQTISAVQDSLVPNDSHEAKSEHIDKPDKLDKLDKINILHFQDISFVTITNNAYVDITLNCIKSLQKINFGHPLEVFCVGKLGYDKLCLENISSTLLLDAPQSGSLSNFQLWGTHNWCEIFYHKLNVIYKKLLEFKYVCATDGDIVYQNNHFMDYLLQEIPNFDILVLNNASNEKNKYDGSSLGLMFIKSSSITLEVFNPLNNPRLPNMYRWYQIFTKKIYSKCKIKLLPLNLFVNGKYIYKNIICTNPYLYHFNFVKPEQKKQLMIKSNMWYI